MTTRTVTIVDPVGATEIADRLNIALNTVTVWRRRHPDFPAPGIVLASGPVWSWAPVASWARATGRLPK